MAPKLVVPGGHEVHWAPFEVTEPSTGGPGTSTAANGPATSSSTSSQAKPATGTTPSKSAAALSAAKATPGKRSFTVQVGLRQAATVRVTVTRKGAKKALGTLTYKAKAGNSSHKITTVGGKRLTAGSYKVLIKVGPTARTLIVRVSAA